MDFLAHRLDEHDEMLERSRLRVALAEAGWVFSSGGGILEPREEIVDRERRATPREEGDPDPGPPPRRSVHIVAGMSGTVKVSRYLDGDTVSDLEFKGHLDVHEVLRVAEEAKAWAREELDQISAAQRDREVEMAARWFTATGSILTPTDLTAITNLRHAMDQFRDLGREPMAVLAPPKWLGAEQGSVIFGLGIWQHAKYQVPCLAVGLL